MPAPKVESNENRIILNFESLEQALQLLKPWSQAQHRAEAARQIHRALEAVGLHLEVRVKGIAVAHVGLGDFQGSMLSLLGLSAAKVRP